MLKGSHSKPWINALGKPEILHVWTQDMQRYFFFHFRASQAKWHSIYQGTSLVTQCTCRRHIQDRRTSFTGDVHMELLWLLLVLGNSSSAVSIHRGVFIEWSSVLIYFLAHHKWNTYCLNMYRFLIAKSLYRLPTAVLTTWNNWTSPSNLILL